MSDGGDDEQKREDEGTTEQTHLPLVRRLEEELVRRRRFLLIRRVLQPEFVEQLSKENQTCDHAQRRRENEENEGFLVQWVVLLRREMYDNEMRPNTSHSSKKVFTLINSLRRKRLTPS